MLDTLMVLWTRGICGRFLQTLVTFLCLFISICVLLFLVTASGVRWPGLASTVSPPVLATPQTTGAPTRAPYILPIILQNPTVLPARTILTPTVARTGWRYHAPIDPSSEQPGDLLTPTPTPEEQPLFP